MGFMQTVKHVLITTTVPTRAKASALGRAVVAARLAACAQLAPVSSVYWWKGKIERGNEVAVHFKTRRALTRRLLTFIRAHHPYEVPEIIVTPILAGWPDYLAWIDRETRTAAPKGRAP